MKACHHIAVNTEPETRKVTFPRESLPPLQFTWQPPGLKPLNSESNIPYDFVSLILVSGCRASFTFQSSHPEFKTIECGCFFRLRKVASCHHPSGRRWEPRGTAPLPHRVQPTGSDRWIGFGPSPGKSRLEFKESWKPDFKIVCFLNKFADHYGWSSDIDLVFRASYMLSMCCAHGESNLASLM